MTRNSLPASRPIDTTPEQIIPEPSSLVIQASLAAVIGCVALLRRQRRRVPEAV